MYNRNMKNVYLIVLDSFGIGNAADAAKFNDEGSNTYKAVYSNVSLPNLHKLGLDNIQGIGFAVSEQEPEGSYARLQELSNGKDTTTGHYEIAGLVVEKPYPVYPDGFPDEVIQKLCRAFGTDGVLGNKAASGTQIIKELGALHESSGQPIVYTSADSVLQIAASVDTFGLDKLYDCCEKARAIMTGEYNVGRIIARPFSKDKDGNYYRTEDRKDYALKPPADTVLDLLDNSGYEVTSIGKIKDIFCGSGINNAITAHSNYEVYRAIVDYEPAKSGLVFANFVDFDMKYGHRNDVRGYADALTQFDSWLPDIIAKLKKDDMLMITADHGCDPSTPSTDHSRENVPLLIYSHGEVTSDLGTVKGFYFIARKIAEFFGLQFEPKKV